MLAKNSIKRSENVRKPMQEHVKLAKLLSITKQLNLAVLKHRRRKLKTRSSAVQRTHVH
jgi:hypothetical protein